ncbi:hypothetical protein D3C87_1761060 [compost metagenome]
MVGAFPEVDLVAFHGCAILFHGAKPFALFVVDEFVDDVIPALFGFCFKLGIFRELVGIVKTHELLGGNPPAAVGLGMFGFGVVFVV